MTTTMSEQERQQEIERVAKILQEKLAGDLLEVARLLVSTKDSEIFGKTEFVLRDRMHQMGAKAIETVLEERKKGGTKAQARSAPPAKRTSASSGIAPKS